MHPKRRVDTFEVLSGIFLLLVLLLILFTAILGNHSVFVVVIGFFPTVLTVLISLTIHEQYAQRQQALWLLPIGLLVAFYFVGMSTPSIHERIDVPVLIGINFILSLLYIIVAYHVFSTPKPRRATAQKETKQETPEQTIEEYIHSIEDKSKALNFVVGRVYNKYHGGTSDIRDKLRIPADWYNEFSLLGIGTAQIDVEQLSDIITRFELQLKNFEKKEFELFKSDAYKLKNLIHDPHGNDKIIDVLDRNDKDPVRSYYEGAVKFCNKVREAIEKQELNLIKNEYIPKTDEEKEEIASHHKTTEQHVAKTSDTNNTSTHYFYGKEQEQKKKQGPKRP